MAEILSQNQIDSLLGTLISGVKEAEAVAPEPDIRVKAYDFRSPKLFTREQLKILFSIYENYAKILSSHVTGVLQTYTHVEIVNIEEQHYSEFNNALPDSVLIGMIDLSTDEEDEDGLMIMNISKEIGFCSIDRLLGGVGKTLENDREYTDIELGILEYFIKGMVHLMKNVWLDFLELTPKLMKLETNSRILQGVGADENVIIVVMNILINDTYGKINICIPAVTLDNLFKKKNAQTKKNVRKADQLTEAQRKADIIHAIHETDLELKGILGTVELLSHELINLEVGDIIKLHKPANALVDLMVEETTWFRGEMGAFHKKRAIAIKEKLERGSDPS
ncbi:MAG: flagellar motor switch protein FliM [Eubacteriales bacterium]|jgi:flagellar motor switch protein FliM|nr:flagellar motor switch protein FliM [Eubacteriales bacterium]MDD3289461.1 flagellar motor switch protein FliM [Eubacteriales bacterium]MDD3863235.1 flagellar motor switch protein FliM [Eubacteriales bacterium]MDD4444367.1 flagellar motor switch protein FliM [Eubacteriales bacterium]